MVSSSTVVTWMQDQYLPSLFDVIISVDDTQVVSSCSSDREIHIEPFNKYIAVSFQFNNTRYETTCDPTKFDLYHSVDKLLQQQF